ncbi:MAG: hypothetical protein ACYSUY_00415 [Planctomycetota bacterium]|jgi:hypothetical protein
MDKESTAFGLSPEQLAHLLKIGSDTSHADNEVDREQKKTELLHDWLTATLPLDAAIAKALPTILRRLCQELRPLAGKAFGDLLKDPKTDIAAIRKIKDYSKKMVGCAKSETEHDAATAIYYAAIASALVFHNQRITKFSYESLNNSFSTLTGHNWLTPDLAQLLKEASEFCREEAKRGGQETKK